MSEWLPLFLPALSALLIIALTGLPIVAGLRVRGFMSIVMTVPAAFASIAIASIIAPIIGLQWSVFVPVVLSVFIGAILWIFTRKTTHARLRVSSMQIWGWPLIAVLFTAVVTAHTLTNGINSADSISQTYDAVFHLNATKLILDTGVASPFAMDLSSPGNPSFYPTLWHATTALIAQLSGASIAVATNAMTFVTASTVWGIGAVALGRSVAGSGRVATLVSGIVASVFPALPLGLASFGVLYPNFLAMTLLPYALVGIAHLWNISIARASDPITPTSRVLLTIGALGASTLAHPNALHAVFLLTVGFSIIAFIPKTSASTRFKNLLYGSLALSAYAIVGLLLWIFGRTTINPWGGSQGPFGALIEALGTAPRFDGHNWVITGFLIVGVAVAFKRSRLWPYVCSLVITLAFYVLADGFPPSTIRELFLSPWYSDPWRLAAILPIAMLPLVVVGLTLLIQLLHPSYMRVASFVTLSRKKAIAGSSCILLALGASLSATSLFPAATYISDRYGSEAQNPRLISDDEYELLNRLGTHVSQNDRILVNPWNGSSLAYALSDREVTMPHMTGNYDHDVWIASQEIVNATIASCTAADNLNARFVLDFGEHYIFQNTDIREELKQISNIDYSPALTEVDRVGDAVLYKITGCNWKDAS